MHATNIAAGAPAWVWILLAALVLLGVRRLRTRELPVAVALLPSAAFLVWSGIGLSHYAGQAGAGTALLAAIAGIAAGAASTLVLREPRGVLLPGGRVRQPGSAVPLVLYLSVFAVRFACGAWAAIVPAQAVLATGLGLAAGAAVTTRLIAGVLRWRRAG